MNYSDISQHLSAIGELEGAVELEMLTRLALIVANKCRSKSDLIAMIGEGFDTVPAEIQQLIADALADTAENATPEYLPHLPASGWAP